jgi:hypothetical protein
MAPDRCRRIISSTLPHLCLPLAAVDPDRLDACARRFRPGARVALCRRTCDQKFAIIAWRRSKKTASEEAV